MSIPRFSIRRPVLTVMGTLIALALGGFSLTRLPIDLLPDISYPTLSISTNYGNANPEEMETLVTAYVEEAVAAVPGVKNLTSTSAEGVSNVRVEFSWGTDLDVAANDIRDRLDRIVDDLPEEADRPQLRKFDASDRPILILGVFSQLPPIELRQIIDEQIQYRLERAPGVASAEVFGGLEREIQVNLDIDKIKALGLPLDRVIDRIRSASLNAPAGVIEQGKREVSVRAPGELASLEELENVVISEPEGAPVYLHTIAQVDDTHARVTRIVSINGQPGVRMGIRKQSGTNTVEVVDNVLKELKELERDFPRISMIPVVDSSEYIRRSIDNVSNTIVSGGFLAVMALLFFLRSFLSTLVIATAIPVSIVATFAFLFFGGFTLNLMTLGGLALGVGMMVDNAIVALENIYRLREQGLEATEAAGRGADEVAAAVVASTITTLVIFLPLAFVEGIAGALFQQLALVVSFSLICSLAVALTVVPMLASLLLKRAGDHAREKAQGGFWARLGAVAEGFFRALEETYGDILALALRWRWLTVLLVLSLFGASLALYPLIGFEFMPASDEARVDVNLEMEVGTRLQLVAEKARQAEDVIRREVPELRHIASSVGASNFRPGAAATAQIQLTLTSASQRERSSEQIAGALRKALAGIPGATVRARSSEGVRLLRGTPGGGDENLKIEIRGYEFAILDALGRQMFDAIKDIPGVSDPRASREAGAPQELFHIDRQRAADAGLTVEQIGRALETALGGTRAGEFRERGDEFRILVKMRQSERLSLEEILDLTLINASGTPVALRNVVTVEPRLGPIQIERKNQERVAYVSANVAGRDLLPVIEEIRRRAERIPRPAGYQILFGGDYEEQQESFRQLLASLALALALVYMVLASLYESLLDPLIVMFSVPLAAIGVLATLFLTDTTLNVQSFIGCIMLGGIVVNNAILLVDQAGVLRTEGWDGNASMVEAGRRRLRPILMTTLTSVLGLIPLALGIGEGAEAQAPLARAVVGGLTSSTLVTLIFIPVVYSLAHRLGPLRKEALQQPTAGTAAPASRKTVEEDQPVGGDAAPSPA
jgi:HAE1 family hydrophobic/amphiphilic exporter-1